MEGSGGMLANKRNFPIHSAVSSCMRFRIDLIRVDELTNRVQWGTRIFEERRKTMDLVCELPDLIERRPFALARAIQQSLE
jgi:hypothetical protein